MVFSAVDLVLVIPDKADPERDQVAAEWNAAGGTTLRLGRFWDPPPLEPTRVRLYGNDTFCLVLEQKLRLALCSPADDLLVTLDCDLLGRRIKKSRLSAVRSEYPAFIKSVIPKQIPSRVYASADELRAECEGLDPETELLYSEPIELRSEVRCFVLDGEVLDCACYEGSTPVDAAREFAEAVARRVRLPRAVVLDVGELGSGRWVVIEFNAAWGAGLNGCDARRVLPAIEAATGPASPAPLIP
ncbi:MAG TPA: ATP-grasp domain-containing protein [Longimicrobium sp.]|jgi:hypothetical protein